MPTDFPWHLKSKSALRSEMYAYRGDLKEAELVELLGAALASAGITAEVQVPVLPEVTNGLSQVEDAVELTNDAEAILADAEAPVADGFDTELDAIRNETDADKKKALYDAMSRRTDEAFRENPTEETYNNMLRVSAAFNGPGDAFAWNDMSDEDKTRLLARVIKRVAESN